MTRSKRTSTSSTPSGWSKFYLRTKNKIRRMRERLAIKNGEEPETRFPKAKLWDYW